MGIFQFILKRKFDLGVSCAAGITGRSQQKHQILTEDSLGLLKMQAAIDFH